MRRVAIVAISIVNGLFILKYGARIHWILALASIPVYCAAVVWLASVAETYIVRVNRAVIVLTAAAVALSLAILKQTDPFHTRVDRWSAITFFLDSLFRGDFPYGVQTHLAGGNTPSPLPFWQLFNTPFYFLRDVGYLQPFVLCLLSAMGLFVIRRSRATLSVLVLIILSPAYWYEVTVRSDLQSNMIVAALFLMVAAQVLSRRQDVSTMFLLGWATGAVACTRVVLGIPLAIFFVGKLRLAPRRAAGTFVVASIGTFALLLYPFYLWSPALFEKYNPLMLQSNKAPLWFQALIVLASLAVSYKMTSFRNILLVTSGMLLLVVGAGFIGHVLQDGIRTAFYGSTFDIAYLNMPLTFAVFSLFDDSSRMRPHPALEGRNPPAAPLEMQ